MLQIRTELSNGSFCIVANVSPLCLVRDLNNEKLIIKNKNMKNNEINEKPALSKMAVSGSVMITEESILEIGFVKHSEYTYKLFNNNVVGYLDEIEVFFEPNEEISIIVRQTTFNTSDLDKNSIFIRDMKYLYELHYLVVVLTGVPFN